MEPPRGLGNHAVASAWMLGRLSKYLDPKRKRLLLDVLAIILHTFGVQVGLVDTVVGCNIIWYSIV